MSKLLYTNETAEGSHITKPELATLPQAHQAVVKMTQNWLEQMVVGLNLCPFSASVIARDQVYFAVCDAVDDAEIHQFYLNELQRLLATHENDIATSLLIFPQGQDAFEDYLSLLDWFQQLLEQAELTEHVQLASFHPQYQFEGVASEDLSHFTNRAPYPTIQLLRQDQMTKVLSHVSNPQKIYEDNIKTLENLGRRKVEGLCPWGVSL